MTFRVGQKVVCIVHATSLYRERQPVVGGIYSIRAIRPRPDGHVGLLLNEIKNPMDDFNGYRSPVEPSFIAPRFRPAVERKTDISIFTSMLNPSKVGA